MAATTVPITASVFRWAREESGYSRTALAKKIDLPVEVLKEWETGISQPTRGHFTSLVKVLKRPSALFFLPEPPTAKGMPTELRSGPGLAGHVLGPKEMIQIRRARRLQEVVSWVLQDDGQSTAAFARHGSSSDPVREASTMRSQSGVSGADQLCWSNASSAFKAWRDYLEDQNVLVLKLSMGKNNIRGFGVWDDYAPLVAVNTAYNEEARIFTLFHEFAHLLTRLDAACHSFVTPNSEILTERWCEQYAAAFLLPEETISREAAKQGIYTNSPTLDPNKVRLLANRFKVSIRAAAIRLQEIGLGEPNLYAVVDSQFAAKDWRGSSGGGGGQRAPQKRINELGKRIPCTLLSAAKRGRLTARDLTDYLQLTTGQLTDIEGLLVESR